MHGDVDRLEDFRGNSPAVMPLRISDAGLRTWDRQRPPARPRARMGLCAALVKRMRVGCVVPDQKTDSMNAYGLLDSIYRDSDVVSDVG